MKDELGGKNNDKFVGLRAKIKLHNYLIFGGSEDEKAKCTKNLHSFFCDKRKHREFIKKQ